MNELYLWVKRHDENLLFTAISWKNPNDKFDQGFLYDECSHIFKGMEIGELRRYSLNSLDTILREVIS